MKKPSDYKNCISFLVFTDRSIVTPHKDLLNFDLKNDLVIAICGILKKNNDSTVDEDIVVAVLDASFNCFMERENQEVVEQTYN